jgi:acetyl-CoA synthetase
VAVLDPETRERVATGETGELAVRPHDRHVFFDEYWNLPEKTAAKQLEAIPDSTDADDGGDHAGENWFLTGDLVERDADGYLWFVSRTDDVILTRGYRVGPMEVESAILDHPAVEQVGVVGLPHETYGEAITAFVQPSEELGDPEGVRNEIRDLVRERLAEYEYPETIEFVSELPNTSTGKIRRKSLRERE